MGNFTTCPTAWPTSGSASPIPIKCYEQPLDGQSHFKPERWVKPRRNTPHPAHPPYHSGHRHHDHFKPSTITWQSNLVLNVYRPLASLVIDMSCHLEQTQETMPTDTMNTTRSPQQRHASGSNVMLKCVASLPLLGRRPHDGNDGKEHEHSDDKPFP